MKETEQEREWAGELGNKYTENNRYSNIGTQLSFFAKILTRLPDIRSVYEVGANVGLNLDALKLLRPSLKLSGCDINAKAVELCVSKGYDVEQRSLYELNITKKYDLVFTKGVLIHLDPDSLESVYKLIGDMSSKYILIDEFFSPKPTAIDNYYGKNNVLFKRDFGRELRDCLDLELMDYGFISKIDPAFPGFDTNWYLFRKRDR